MGVRNVYSCDWCGVTSDGAYGDRWRDVAGVATGATTATELLCHECLCARWSALEDARRSRSPK